MLDYYDEPYDEITSSTAHGKPPPIPPRVLPENEGVLNNIHSTVESNDAGGQQLESSGEAIPSGGEDSIDRNESDLTHLATRTNDGPMVHHPAKNSLPKPQTVEDRYNLKRFYWILGDPQSSHEQIYNAYNQFPSPRIEFLSNRKRHDLLHRLSVIEIKSKKAMLRYLSVVDDVQAASIPLKNSEWSSAIAYAGRCFARVEASQVESALHIWKDMEQEAGVRSGTTTFNILFDIATKAGKYVLAEMILKEMNVRKVEYDQFSYVGFIYYHGLKGDATGVRKAYRDLVEAGAIVDTTVMNCVMVSLIRCGEPSAAEQVYERMKRMLQEKTGHTIPSSDWREARKASRELDKAFRSMRHDRQQLDRLQAEQCLAPNIRTFSIFIDYHVHITGELRRIAALLYEMQHLEIPMNGRIFVKVFQGFARHGGVKYTSWTNQRLETVWEALVQALDEGVEGVYMMKWMVIWVIRAFARCCGRARALQIWEELRSRWKAADDEEKGTVEHILRDVLDENSPERRGE
ncbi:MAG: hypothetical protein LQ350_004655 [Teloschistes chrysophthalmus]|nr:MAG: hypothetical protein LQ350_004655 [Niorma chrysophthalma]